MSRIGKKAIEIPAGTTVEVNENVVTVKGPKGTLVREFNKDVEIKVEANSVHVSLPENASDFASVYHGTARALIHNMVVGASKGYEIPLEVRGTGYRFTVSGNKLTVIVGYSNPVEVMIPEGIKVDCPDQNNIIIKGADKEQLGEFAANVRLIRKPEPYHGKGIRYKNENVRHKEGKTAK